MNVSYELILIDNASSDESVKAVKNLKQKNITVIANSDNKGFAKANNQGIKIARGKYVLLLNTDTYLTEDSVGECISNLEADKEIGVISCQLKNKDGSLQPTGGYFPTPFNLTTWMLFINHIPFVGQRIRPFHPKSSFYTQSQELDWVTGAFFMFPITLTSRVGFLDEDYFMYVEELDFCYRVKQQKLKVFYLHDHSIVHLGRASGSNEFAIQSEIKNILLFYKKHISSGAGYARTILKFGTLLRMVIFAILGKEKERTIYEKTFAAI